MSTLYTLKSLHTQHSPHTQHHQPSQKYLLSLYQNNQNKMSWNVRTYRGSIDVILPVSTEHPLRVWSLKNRNKDESENKG